MQNTELRPLGAGEILDRAVTLYVRRFVLIVAVLAAVIVPLLAVEAIVAPGSSRVLDDVSKVMTSAGRAKVEALTQLSRDSRTNSGTYVILLGSALVRLLMFSAVIAVIAAGYSGARTTFAAAYLLALRRWPEQFFVALAFLVLALIVAFTIALAALALSLAVALFGAGSPQWAAIGFGIAVMVLFVALFASVGCWLYMAYNLAAVSVVTENADVPTAIGAGLRRALGTSTRWRTLVAGLIAAAISLGGSIPLAAVAAAASGLLRQPALYFAIAGTGAVLLEGLVAAFVVVFATDVRVRREGLDLALAAQPAGA